MTPEEKRVRLLNAASELNTAADQARERLISRRRLCAGPWRDPDHITEVAEDFEYAAWALTLLDYPNESMDPKQTLVAPGVILIEDQPTLEALHALNDAKQRFQACCALADTEPRQAIDGQMHAQSTCWLRQYGYARLNRRHAYRQIRVIDPAPDRISLTWTARRLVYRRTRDQVRNRIDRHIDDPARREQLLDQLAQWPDQSFAEIHDPGGATPAANLVWRTPSVRKQHLKAPLPLVVTRWPSRVRPIPPGRGRSDIRRPRHLIESEPWCPELNLYRYTQQGEPTDENH